MSKHGELPAGSDPLLYSFPLPLRETLFPLGFPLEIATNDARVLDAAREGFGCFRERRQAPPVRLHLAVAPGPEEIPARTVYRGQRHLFSIVCDAHNFAVCDFAARFAYGWITAAVAAQGDWLRFRFLEAVTYSVLVQADLTPVHAACVSRNGRGLLLCATSGTGKTTLAFACARAGWTYVSDDAVYLLRNQAGNTVLGKPYGLRFEASAAALFDELRDHPVTRDPHGQLRLELRTSGLPGFRMAESCQAGGVVFLERGGAAGLSALSRAEALERMLRDLPRYEDRVWQEQARSLDRLLDAPRWRLSYPDYPAALPLLESLLD